MQYKTKISALLSVSALGLAVGFGPVLAQEGNEEVVDQVTVTGFRGSLAQALDVKRDASGIVDAIVAEDIAEFPDLNLAESLQRIPGISINRVNGEGRQITVRGLGGDFTRTRINGMEAMSTTGASDASGGTNRGRAFDFNTFASELFNRITVTKSSQASIEEGSLGATVDLRTARPFDYDEGVTMAASLQMGYNELSEENNPRMAGLLSYANADKSFGALFSIAYSERSILEEGFSTVRWQDANFNSVDGAVAGAAAYDAIDGDSNVLHPRIPRYGRLTHEQERTGMTGSVQFTPTDHTTVSLDAMYSMFDATREEAFLEVFFRSQEGGIDVRSPNIDTAKSIVDYALFDIPVNSNGTHPIRSENRFDILETEFTQYTLDIDHEFSDRMRGSLLVGTSESEFNNPVQTTIFFDAASLVTGYSYDFRNSANTPAIDFGDLDVTDASQFLFTEFRDRPNSTKNTFDTITADFEYDLSDQYTLKVGLSTKEYEFVTKGARRESTYGSRLCGQVDASAGGGSFACAAGANGLAITSDIVKTITGYGSDLGGSGYDLSWITPNAQAAAELIGAYDIPAKDNDGDMRSVKEEDEGIYVQLDFENTIANYPIRGNIGVRYVETTTSSTGLVGGVSQTIERSYDDTLPALNLAIEATDDVLVRFAMARVMARPSLGNLTPGGSLDSFTGPPFAYNAGNPGLDPYRADNIDLSVEWYFAPESLFAVSYFEKDVKSYFQQSAQIETRYSQTGLAADLAPASSPLRVAVDAGQDPLVTLSTRENGSNAELDGWEVAFQAPFTFLPAPFDRFGIQANYTSVDSDKIQGFSDDSYNATIYYEDDRLSARVSTAYRDKYQTGTSGGYPLFTEETTTVDFASSYELNDNVQLTFEALNLTDEFEDQTYTVNGLNYVHHHTGTEYLIGARVKY